MNRRVLRYNPNRRRSPDETNAGPILKLLLTVAGAAALVLLIVLLLPSALERFAGDPGVSRTPVPENAETAAPERVFDGEAQTLRLPVTLEDGALIEPSIFDGKLLFAAGEDDLYPDRLYEYDFATGKTASVEGIELSFDAVRSPVQNDRYLLYVDEKAAGGGAVRVLEKAAGKTRWLCDLKYGVPELHLDGRYLVYLARTDEESTELFVIDIENNLGMTLEKFSGAEYGASEPDLADGRIVYANAGADGSDAGAIAVAEIESGARETLDEKTFVHDPKYNGTYYAFVSGVYGTDTDLYVQKDGGRAVCAARGVLNFGLVEKYAVYALGETVYAFDLESGTTCALSEESARAVLLCAENGYAFWRETQGDGTAVYRYMRME